MSDLTVAKTMLEQIKMIDPRALMAWGAKEFVGSDNSLRFRSSGLVKNKGIVTIRLNSMDLYDIEFGKIRNHEYKVVNRMEDIYAEDMVAVIDGMVG